MQVSWNIRENVFANILKTFIITSLKSFLKTIIKRWIKVLKKVSMQVSWYIRKNVFTNIFKPLFITSLKTFLKNWYKRCNKLFYIKRFYSSFVKLLWKHFKNIYTTVFFQNPFWNLFKTFKRCSVFGGKLCPWKSIFVQWTNCCCSQFYDCDQGTEQLYVLLNQEPKSIIASRLKDLTV